jgi:hypothetical protein
MWKKELWLIDHGASFYFHHSWDNWKQQSERPFVQVKDHVLLPWASALEEVNAIFLEQLTPEKIKTIVSFIPAEWLVFETLPDPEANRKVYEEFLINRFAHAAIFLNEAQHARKAII